MVFLLKIFIKDTIAYSFIFTVPNSLVSIASGVADYTIVFRWADIIATPGK